MFSIYCPHRSFYPLYCQYARKMNSRFRGDDMELPHDTGAIPAKASVHVSAVTILDDALHGPFRIFRD